MLKLSGVTYKPSNNFTTPLHSAANRGSLEIVELFLEKNLETKIVNDTTSSDDLEDEKAFYDAIDVNEAKKDTNITATFIAA